MYTNAAVQLGNVTLNSRAFWVWSTVLTLLLVVLWLAASAATILGVFKGSLLELSQGWNGQYYEHNAETEKRMQQQQQEEEDHQQNANGNGRREADGSSKESHQD